MIFGLGLLAAVGTVAPPSAAARDVDICDLAASPATYAGQTVRVRAVASADLDNIPWLISDCGGRPKAVVLGPDLVKDAQQPLHDYRVPEAVMQAGAFNITVTMTGQIKREAVRSGFQVHDTGFYLLPMYVSDIEAVHVELPPVVLTSERLREMKRRLDDILSLYPPPPPSRPSPAGSAPRP